MNVSSMAASSYAAINSISKYEPPKATSDSYTSFGPDVVVTFSDEALDLMRLRDVSDENAK